MARAIVILFCTVLLTLLMMTVESMLSKRPFLRIDATLFFLPKLWFYVNFQLRFVRSS